MSDVHVAAVIPARMASTRYPGKPLINIHGLPMVEHVRRRVEISKAFNAVVVATCDTEIEKTIKKYGGKVLMTSPDHPGATDRVVEAANHLDCTHVVNIQGDELLILPEDLRTFVEAIKSEPTGLMWNAIAPINDKQELTDQSIVKCVVSKSNKILFCSRNISNMPFKGSFDPIRIVLGLLGYQKSFLNKIKALKRTPAEELERIDQNRIVENDLPLIGVPLKKGYPGINEPREVNVINSYLSNDDVQRKILKEILQDRRPGKSLSRTLS